MKKVLKILIKILIILFFSLLLVEFSLHIFSKLYIHRDYSKNVNQIVTDENSLRIMFIGDSWTAGAGAEFSQGYVDVFLSLLRKEYPDTKIEGFNYAQGSFNSSQACLEFLKHYRKVKPHLLVALIGINNIWNTQDLSLVRRYFDRELGFEAEDKCQIYILERILSWLNKLRIVKLARIAYFNLILKQVKMVGPHPMDDHYVAPCFEILSRTADKEKVKECLIQNIDKASSYDDFYRLMLYLFSFQSDDVKDFLQKRHLWKPWLITFKFNQKQHDSIVSLRHEILEEHLIYLKKICKLNNTKMIVQNYPQYGFSYVIDLNNALFQIAMKIDVPFVDHYTSFIESLGIEGFKNVLTRCSHVNTEGHYLMAQNLYKTIAGLKMLEMEK